MIAQNTISADDLRLLLGLLPQLEKEANDARALLIEKQDKLLAEDCTKVCWYQFYEMPIREHLQRIINFIPFGDGLQKVADSPNQIQEAVAFLESFDQALDAEKLTDAEAEDLRPGLAAGFGLAVSLVNSLRCLMMFGCYLSDLIALVRLGGKDGDVALFNAIKIDPTVLGSTSVISRISTAVLVGDTRFLNKLKAAINGKFTKRQQANFEKMRLVMKVLEESGAGRLTNAYLYELFVKELKLYATDSKRGDVHKNLRKFADQYMKASATT